MICIVDLSWHSEEKGLKMSLSEKNPESKQVVSIDDLAASILKKAAASTGNVPDGYEITVPIITPMELIFKPQLVLDLMIMAPQYGFTFKGLANNEVILTKNK